ncbi:MAG TPA: argininosuccinate lyase, partial [Archaeoglobus profundus]|nr:argininosuccinate lyase [Archaeoglobus profundus]
MLRSRLKEEMNKLAFEYSLSKDEKIFYYDILVDIAHVLGLLKCGHISEGDARSIIKALIEVRDAGYKSLPSCEDVHEAIEYAVTKKTEAGKKMHTARSRNDE